MNFMSPRAAAATVLLHAGLIAATLHPSDDNARHTPAAPLEVRIVPAQETPAAATSLSAPPSPPAPPPAASFSADPVKKRAPIKPRAEIKPAGEASAQQAPAEPAPPPAAETKRAAPAAAPSAPAATEPAARGERSAPVKTSASEAAYAASNRKPVYPRLSRVSNEQGTVILRVLVKADGSAGQVEIRTSSGYPLLDKSASTTVQSWRFSPATANGKPVDEWYEVAIPFKLVDD